ncbi:MAG: hypothetical protein WB975_11380 [Nitrososphaeraceae archaeon]
MARKGNLSFILMFFGTLLAGGLLNWTFEHVYGDTNLQFAISECPVLSNGVSEESGQCPDLKTIQNEGNHIVDEQSGTRPPITSALVNPFGP